MIIDKDKPYEYKLMYRTSSDEEYADDEEVEQTPNRAGRPSPRMRSTASEVKKLCNGRRAFTSEPGEDPIEEIAKTVTGVAL
jgi:hypothetical protein